MPTLSTSPPLRLGYVNVGGLASDRLQSMLQVCHDGINGELFDFLCVGETWFHTTTDAASCSFEGYHALAHCMRPPGRAGGRGHGGVSVYARTGAAAWWGPTLASTDPANGLVWIDVPSCRLTILACYLAPTNSTWWKSHPTALPAILSGLTAAHGKGFATIILGDFNAHMGMMDCDVPGESDFDAADDTFFDNHIYTLIPKPRVSSDARIDDRGHNIMDLLRSCQTVLLNGRAPGNNAGHTFRSQSHNTTSVLDYACISAEHYRGILDFSVFDGGWPDHMLLSLSWQPTAHPPAVPQDPPSGRIKHIYRPPVALMSLRDHADDYFRAYVGPLAKLHHALAQGMSLSTTLPSLVSIIQHVADMRVPSLDGHAPLAQGWWDASCLAAKQAGREAYGSFLRLKRSTGVGTPATADAQAHFNRLRSAYRSLRRRKKYEWGEKREEALLLRSITNPQVFWRSVCGTAKQPLPIQDLSVWTDHFAGVLDPAQEAPEFGGAHDPFQNEEHRQNMKRNLIQLPQCSRLQQQQQQHPAYMEALNAEVTCDEVNHCLKLLHRGRMADADGLTAEALQYCWMGWRGKTDMDASPSPACQLFRECLRGVLQQMWTEECMPYGRTV